MSGRDRLTKLEEIIIAECQYGFLDPPTSHRMMDEIGRDLDAHERLKAEVTALLNDIKTDNGNLSLTGIAARLKKAMEPCAT